MVLTGRLNSPSRHACLAEQRPRPPAGAPPRKPRSHVALGRRFAWLVVLAIVLGRPAAYLGQAKALHRATESVAMADESSRAKTTRAAGDRDPSRAGSPDDSDADRTGTIGNGDVGAWQPDAPTNASDPDAGGGPIVKVGLNDRVTMHVAGLPLSDVLRMLSEPTHKNVVLAEGAEGTVSASLYDVSFEEALQAVLVANNLGCKIRGDFIYVYPLEKLAEILQSERKIATRVFRLTYVNAAAAMSLVEPMLSKIGKAAVTPPSSAGIGAGGNSSGIDDTKGDAVATPDTLVVTDYVERLDEIAEILKELDQRPRQVLIEATILRASLDEDNSLGIDFTTVGGIDFTTLSSTSPAAQSITTGNTPQQLLGDTTLTARTDFNSTLPRGGFTFGVVKDQIGVFLRALEQIADTEIIANPKILALNKQVGQVIVGRRDGYLTTTITETTAIQTVEFLETGTLLTFRPFIGDDGFVRMEIHPKDSSGGVEDNLPWEATTEVTSNILVQDGRTVLIGGLFREVDMTERSQVPVLGDIPIGGSLFRRTIDSVIREEVIILLTVHVLKGEPDNAAGEALQEDAERFRVGMRRGAQWLSRERLAQAHYRWALEHLDAGDLDKALWDAELAIHNYPRHIDAWKLREKIRGRRSWEAEASAIRHYVRDRIAEERGIETAPYERPAPPFRLPKDLQGPTGTEDEERGAAPGNEDGASEVHASALGNPSPSQGGRP